MISEIKIYQIVVEMSVPFLIFFKKKETIKYTLSYRIDEDRLWYYKEVNDRVADDHLMKQNLSNSITTIKNISSRFNECNEIIKNKYSRSITTFSLEENNPDLYALIDSYSSSKEEYYKEKERKLSTSFLD